MRQPALVAEADDPCPRFIEAVEVRAQVKIRAGSSDPQSRAWAKQRIITSFMLRQTVQLTPMPLLEPPGGLARRSNVLLDGLHEPASEIGPLTEAIAPLTVEAGKRMRMIGVKPKYFPSLNVHDGVTALLHVPCYRIGEGLLEGHFSVVTLGNDDVRA